MKNRFDERLCPRPAGTSRSCPAPAPYKSSKVLGMLVETAFTEQVAKGCGLPLPKLAILHRHLVPAGAARRQLCSQ